MSELDNNRRKRENFTANIIFSIIFGVGSFIFYKTSGETLWAIFLFIASIILLFCYSNILELEEENIELNNAFEEEEIEEEYIDEEEIEEERRALYEKNVVAFKKEAKIKYDEIAKQLGKSSDCLSDDNIDIWLVDGRIISMLKWKIVEDNIDDYEGEYTDMIIEGMSGRNIDFEYGLERYKNMPKYGDNGIEHTFITVSEEKIDNEESEEVEEVEDNEKEIEEGISDKDNNLIAQIFEKLIS